MTNFDSIALNEIQKIEAAFAAGACFCSTKNVAIANYFANLSPLYSLDYNDGAYDIIKCDNVEKLFDEKEN